MTPIPTQGEPSEITQEGVAAMLSRPIEPLDAVDPVAQLTPDQAFEARLAAGRPGLRRSLHGHRPVSPAKELRDLAHEAAGLDASQWDRYGEGGPVRELEQAVADALGMPAAAMFPTGVMAQQAALRVWTGRQACRAVALPGLSHLLVHELDGPHLLHGFRWCRLSEGAAFPTASDLAAEPSRLGAALLELPLRDAGFLLPSWPELVAFSDACRDRGVPLHLDGARLWEAAASLERTPAQVSALADSVYVSLYKGLGGLAGAVLAGPADVVAESRQWRRRQGGTLPSMVPYAVGGLRGLRQQLPRMGEYRQRALELAEALVARGVRVYPDPPQATAFRLLAEASQAELDDRLLRCVEEDRTFAVPRFRRSEVPGWCWTELSVGSATMDWDTVKAADYLAHLLLDD